MATSRILMGWTEMKDRLQITEEEQKLFLACGAAAGVSAGFNAPISAVFFALEVVQAAFNAESCKIEGIKTTAPESLSSPQSASSILAASVSSALISRAILQDHLTLILSSFSLKSPLLELPLYVLLGALSGVVAFVVGRLSKEVSDAFAGNGPQWTQNTVAKIPNFWKPVVGGLVCGTVGLAYPQILFFGYETLNSLLANKSMDTSTLLSLLGVKMCTTAIATGSGLVGGAFAPSLFYGSMLGASVHNAAQAAMPYLNGAVGPSMEGFFSISGVPAYSKCCIFFLSGFPACNLRSCAGLLIVASFAVFLSIFHSNGWRSEHIGRIVPSTTNRKFVGV
jgi:H+/Cl- antiporter ClcA